MYQVSDDVSVVNGQSVYHIGQAYEADSVIYNMEQPYKWISSWSTTGRRQNQR